MWNARITSRWGAFGCVHPGHLSCSLHLNQPDDTCYWWSLSFSLSLSLSHTHTHTRARARTHTNTKTHKHRRCRMLLLLVRHVIIFIWRIYCLYLLDGFFVKFVCHLKTPVEIFCILWLTNNISYLVYRNIYDLYTNKILCSNINIKYFDEMAAWRHNTKYTSPIITSHHDKLQPIACDATLLLFKSST